MDIFGKKEIERLQNEIERLKNEIKRNSESVFFKIQEKKTDLHQNGFDVLNISHTKQGDWVLVYALPHDSEKLNYIYIHVIDEKVDLHVSYTFKHGGSKKFFRINYFNIPNDPKYVNRGYGSLLMKELLYRAARNGVDEVSGDLTTESSDDPKYEQRLISFYKKFHFTITQGTVLRGFYLDPKLSALLSEQNHSEDQNR